MPFHIKTQKGTYLTAVNGGGFGGPNTGPVALHTDAKVVGDWETFTIEWVDPAQSVFALKIHDYYITAVGGGGIGGPNDARCPIHTDATLPKEWETFVLVDHGNNKVSIRTKSGNYLTAVNGGGIGGANDVPIHTDATKRGPWETFTYVVAII